MPKSGVGDNWMAWPTGIAPGAGKCRHTRNTPPPKSRARADEVPCISRVVMRPSLPRVIASERSCCAVAGHQNEGLELKRVIFMPLEQGHIFLEELGRKGDSRRPSYAPETRLYGSIGAGVLYGSLRDEDADKTGVCLSGASNVLAANSKSKTHVPCLFGGDESRCFDKARRSFNNHKLIDLIVDNEYNRIYGPEQTTSTVFNRVYGRFGACKPFRMQWEQTQRTV
ncbi:hypothetical protein FB451DRAFT_1365342 [Mycena latifolia]|nr:hypothetical protein FB451DRAFT_1365342 [Mycena latifolia]